MSAFNQQRFLRAMGISLVTMLVLALAQELTQLSGWFDAKQMHLLLWVLFPLFAILSGAAARFMTGSLWAAVIISLVAFSVVILVLFSLTTLFYVPGYVILSWGGYSSAELLQKRAQKRAV